jgi:hypothetical protein
MALDILLCLFLHISAVPESPVSPFRLFQVGYRNKVGLKNGQENELGDTLSPDYGLFLAG